MTSQWMVFPTLALAMSASLAADDAPGTVGGPSVAYLDTARAGPGSWQTTPDRLAYLRGRAGCGSACSGSSMFPGLEPASMERDYIDALDLVSYGDMDVKFTGDRVKLKVRF